MTVKPFLAAAALATAHGTPTDPAEPALTRRPVVGAISPATPPATLQAPSPATPQAPAESAPFGVGERMSYEVRFGPMKVGNGSMEVLGI